MRLIACSPTFLLAPELSGSFRMRSYADAGACVNGHVLATPTPATEPRRGRGSARAEVGDGARYGSSGADVEARTTSRVANST